MTEVVIYTDGACSGNPGPGGWAAILIYNQYRKEMNGSEADTTNNSAYISFFNENFSRHQCSTWSVIIWTDR